MYMHVHVHSNCWVISINNGASCIMYQQCSAGALCCYSSIAGECEWKDLFLPPKAVYTQMYIHVQGEENHTGANLQCTYTLVKPATYMYMCDQYLKCIKCTCALYVQWASLKSFCSVHYHYVSLPFVTITFYHAVLLCIREHRWFTETEGIA